MNSIPIFPADSRHTDNVGGIVDTQEVFDSIIANSGGTFACRNGIRPVTFRDGYMVSLESKEHRIPLSDFKPVEIDRYIACHRNWVGGIGYYLGAWVDGDSVYLDVSMRVDSKLNAMEMGRKRSQLAIWDNENGEAITL